ncbi:MAG: hypothetical protein NTX64_18850 [Elusimicrobia bacterium]|nr:hypothetical protein [Elusimicrobiota bacterium]
MRPYLNVIARAISWLCIAAMLLLVVAAIIEDPVVNVGNGILACFAVAHLVQMLRGKYSFAFKCACGELFVGFFVLFFYLYPPGPEAGGREPPMAIDLWSLGFWLWTFGGSMIASAAWICYRAAQGSVQSGREQQMEKATANIG